MKMKMKNRIRRNPFGFSNVIVNRDA